MCGDRKHRSTLIRPKPGPPGLRNVHPPGLLFLPGFIGKALRDTALDGGDVAQLARVPRFRFGGPVVYPGEGPIGTSGGSGEEEITF